jgi:hypothetical protein
VWKWPVTLREENKLRIFDSGVLRALFLSESEEVTED